ncbi:glycosyltransferase [Telluria aromaticivorans]|uniref:Glycosyltransferase family 4 protein n=1 Tax=Telluria aromaticivorans TaxID=2725995 RepID=A0A7Y2NZS7_9BURK|nr:glycosyltransferase [Telluria aromaticivorans]NNG24222.1 glycosyltransferase family 4 protein [Telluria aromaticivorans]
MVKRALMIAFHFPPQRGSSGIQRTLKFVQHLPGLGWEPLVLTAHPRAHADTEPDQMKDIASSVVVRRAFALDTARHLAWRGRYLGTMALPDRWVSWVLGAVPAGLAMIRRYRPQLIWSTYPIASAHLIGLALRRLTGLPWVADLRDPMIDASHPSGRLKRAIVGWIEAQTLAHCTRAVCTTPGAVRSYRARYPALPPERICLIENGYDEAAFAAASQETPPAPAAGPLVLLHSGIVYPSERDPRPLFGALAALRARGRITPATFRLVLRAPVHDDWLATLASEHGIDDIVTIAPALPYRAALAEMLGAGALLVLQASNCNDQVPAKLYEYLRAGRPVLALTDENGDTARTLRKLGIDTIGPLDDAEGIAQALERFLDLVAQGSAPLATDAMVRTQERGARTVQLGALFDAVLAEDSALRGARQAAKSSKAP